VVAERGLISYACLARVDRYLHSAGVFVRDVLKSFDLTQVAGAVADRPLALLSPVGPMKEVDISTAQREYQFTRQTYDRAGVADRFVVSRTGGEPGTAEEYLRLLGGR
jgi:hypothetical protein